MRSVRSSLSAADIVQGSERSAGGRRRLQVKSFTEHIGRIENE